MIGEGWGAASSTQGTQAPLLETLRETGQRFDPGAW